MKDKRILIFALIIIVMIGTLFWWLRPVERDLNSVGFLFPDSMYDQTWGTEGYKGMLKIVQTHDIAFYYEQNINDEKEIAEAVAKMAERKVNIIYGQGIEYAKPFDKLAKKYKDVHFVVFNGKSNIKNLSAVNIDGYAMGYFCGMIASHQSKTHKIGIVAAYRTQPEVQGYIDGAQFDNKQTEVVATFINTFSYDSRGRQIAEDMIDKDDVDVIFPAADGVNPDIMTLLKEDDVYAIGFISDQKEYGDQVLTSMKINISDAYVRIADEYKNGSLNGGTRYLGINENAIGLGQFSYRIEKDYQEKIKDYLNQFKQKHLLPNGQEPPKQYNEKYLNTLK